MGNIITYKNGNYDVFLDTKTGTKIRAVKKTDDFKPDHAESIDLTISKKCNRGCEYCYLGCTPTGEEPDILKWEFLDTLHPYTELAVNVNFPLHPQIFEFLCYMKIKKVIVNVTVNQLDFMQNVYLFDNWWRAGLIHGIGISLVDANGGDKFKKTISHYDNVVLHVINGVITMEQFYDLANNGFKILILGYKNRGRGRDYFWNRTKDIDKNMDFLRNELISIMSTGQNWFESISFDCLALKQLSIKEILPEETWNGMYLGEDGQFTFAIDLTDGTYAISSTSVLKYPIGSLSVDEMFHKIQEVNEKKVSMS